MNFVQWHINLLGLFNAKAIPVWHYLTNNLGDKGIHTFRKSISPKANVIAQLEFELATVMLHSSALTTMPREFPKK